MRFAGGFAHSTSSFWAPSTIATPAANVSPKNNMFKLLQHELRDSDGIRKFLLDGKHYGAPQHKLQENMLRRTMRPDMA
jgi:hypothetical protein